ncbi:MAG: AAA family ATPase [Limnochordaceae bacterium]|nr:AAA family ATPase [Limnochordaceae bacterium]
MSDTTSTNVAVAASAMDAGVPEWCLRIRRLHVDRFGVLSDVTSPVFEPGRLVVIWGENEAGKSTLLRFCQQVLFGFERNASLRDSGPPGGWLEWEMRPAGGGVTESGARTESEGWQPTFAYRWERVGASRPRGGQVRLVELNLAADGIAREFTPEQIAAFLQHWWGGVSAELYRSVYAFGLSELERVETLKSTEISAHLFAAQAGLGTISLPQVEKQLEEEMRAILAPRSLGAQINGLLHQRREIEEKEREWEAQAGRYADLLEKEQYWEAQGRQWQQAAEEARLRWERAQRILRGWPDWETLRQTNVALRELPDTTGFPADGLTRLEERERQEAELELDRGQLLKDEASLEQECESLHLTPEQQGLLADEPRWELLWQDMGRLEPLLARLERERLAWARCDAQLTDGLARLGAGWTPDRVQSLDDSPVTLQELETARNQLDQAAAIATERRRQWEEVVAQTTESQGRTGLGAASAGRRSGLVWLVMAAGLGLAVALAQRGEWMIGTGVVVLTVLIWLNQRTQQRAEQQASEERKRAEQERDQRQQTARRAWEEAQRAQQEAERRWQQVLQRHGLQALASWASPAISAWFQEAGKVRQLWRDRQEAEAAWRSSLVELAGLLRRWHELSRDERLEQLLPAGEPPASWRPDQPEMAALLERARQVLAAELPRYRQALDRSREQQRHRDEKARRLAEVRERLKQVEGRLQAVRAQKQQLLQQAGVTDTEAFRQRAESWARRRQLREQRQQAAVRLGVLLRPEAMTRQDSRGSPLVEADEIEDEFGRLVAGKPITEWESEAEQARQTLEQAQEEARAAVEQLGRVRAERQALEAAYDAAQLAATRAGLEQEVDRAARQWAVRALALGLLRRTRGYYERERQPEVIQRAAGYFQRLTAGRYRRLIVPFGASEGLGFDQLQVEREDGTSLRPEELSRGTAEQLYLAFRLAFIEGEESSRALPVLLDDPLVNFDKPRLQRALDVLLAVAAQRQVFLFTCHPHMVEAAQDAAERVGGQVQLWKLTQAVIGQEEVS